MTAFLLVCLLAMSTACFSYRATVSIDNIAGSSGTPTRSEITRAANVVARSVEGLELVPDPRVERIIRDSKESDETDSVVVGLFRTRTEQDYWIEVWLLVEKKTGRLSVAIEDRLSPLPSELTQAVEAAIISELVNEFPLATIQSMRGTVGPSLGP